MKKYQSLLSIYFVVALMSFPSIIIHECTHWIFHVISPYTEPFEIGFLNQTAVDNHATGYVKFIVTCDKLPSWYHMLSEGIAYSVQIFFLITISIFILTKGFHFCKKGCTSNDSIDTLR